MQLEVTAEQSALILNLVNSRISEIHPEIRRSRVYSVHDELKRDLEVLQELQARLQKQRIAGAWEGYAEGRKVPSNPPPGS